MDFLRRKKEKKSEEGQALRGAGAGSADRQDVYPAGAFEGDPPTGSFYAPAVGGLASPTSAGKLSPSGGGFAGSKGGAGNAS
jgi:hypothetical protein